MNNLFANGPIVSLQCSVTCGAGKMQRHVRCRAENGTLVDSSLCSEADRPNSIENCSSTPCPTQVPSTTRATTTTPAPIALTTTAPPLRGNQVFLASPGFIATPLERPANVSIRIPSSYNEIEPIWKIETNDTQIVGIWRTDNWGPVNNLYIIINYYTYLYIIFLIYTWKKKSNLQFIISCVINTRCVCVNEFL